MRASCVEVLRAGGRIGAATRIERNHLGLEMLAIDERIVGGGTAPEARHQRLAVTPEPLARLCSGASCQSCVTASPLGVPMPLESSLADPRAGSQHHGVGPLYVGLVAVIPALDEEGSIGEVVAGLIARGVSRVIVADNGSRDRTAAVARAAGAEVVAAPRRGYGSACLAALRAVPADARAIVFCDGDGADDLGRLAAIARPVLDGQADLVIGSRALGVAQAGSLTLPQRAGNVVAAALLGLLFGARVTDLGPFRCISTKALGRLGMRDPDFGWTAEMQTKALRLGLRVSEVAVDARARAAGESKISGRIGPVFRAGYAILSTILVYRFKPMARVGADHTSKPKAIGT